MPQYNPQDFNGTFWTVYDGDYYVSTTGNDITGTGHPGNPFLTVAKAFDLAVNGEKIIIGPFEYVAYENLGGSGGGGGAELPCRVATTSNIPIPGGALTVDGVLLSVGDRVLVWRQSGPAQNGVYIVTSSGWERDPNFNNSDNIVGGKLVPVLGGNTHAKSVFQLTTDGTINVGSTYLTFEEVAVADWGEIGGTLTNQTDLTDALNLKADDTALDSHIADISNPHSVTKAQVGLGNANNTSDANKPVSTAQQSALDTKANIAYVDSQISGLTATIDKATPKGTIDASSNPGYPAGDLGDYYYITNAGSVGGDVVEVGDKVQCIADTAAGQGSNWVIFQGNLDVAQNADMETRTNDAKYVTPATSFHGWNHWTANEAIAALNTSNKTIVGAINEAASSGGILNLVDSGSDVVNSGTGTGFFHWDSLRLNGNQLTAADQAGSSHLVVRANAGSGDSSLSIAAGSSGSQAYSPEINLFGNAFLGDTGLRRKLQLKAGEGSASVSIIEFWSGTPRVLQAELLGDGNWDFQANLLRNLANPIDPQDAATKAYVDASGGGAIATHEIAFGTGTGLTSIPNIARSGTGITTDELKVGTGDGNVFEYQAGNGFSIFRTDVYLNDNTDLRIGQGNGSTIGDYDLRYNSVRNDVTLNAGNSVSTNLVLQVLGTDTWVFDNGIPEMQFLNGSALNMGGGKIQNLANPIEAQDAATKAYVDANGGGNISKGPNSSLGELAVWSGETEIEGTASGLKWSYPRILMKNSFDELRIGSAMSTYASVSSGSGIQMEIGTTDLSIIGSVFPAQDDNSNPLIKIIGNQADKTNLVNRPILAEYNNETKLLEVAASGTRDYQGNLLKNLADPIDSQDAATKAYVDTNTGGSLNNIQSPSNSNSIYYYNTVGGDERVNVFHIPSTANTASIAQSETVLYFAQNSNDVPGADIWSPSSGFLQGNGILTLNQNTRSYLEIHLAQGFDNLSDSTRVARFVHDTNSARLDMGGNDISGVGTGTANTNWVIASDERLKTQVDEIPDALSIVRNLQGHRFERKDLEDGVTRIGFMAQEVNDHLPEVIVNDFDKWFMDYSSVTALHNEAIKSVDNEVVELKEKLLKLEAVLNKHGITL